jgi:hypothetical protein
VRENQNKTPWRQVAGRFKQIAHEMMEHERISPNDVGRKIMELADRWCKDHLKSPAASAYVKQWASAGASEAANEIRRRIQTGRPYPRQTTDAGYYEGLKQGERWAR